jgi:hypothetical protein
MDKDTMERVFYTLSAVLAVCLTTFVVALTVEAVKYILEGNLR